MGRKRPHSKNQVYAASFDSPLDRGISYAVKVLREAGIETYESCESGEGHCFPEPTVRFHGGHAEGYRAVTVALTHGLPVFDLRRAWRVSDGELVGPSWEMTFFPVEALKRVQHSAEESGLI